MLSWLRNKISENIARTYQELHNQRLQETSKSLPKEIMKVNEVLAVLNDNSWAIHHLFKKAKHQKQYANAFLYFLYSLELTLKHLIISEMHSKNMVTAVSNIENQINFFSVYSEDRILNILGREGTLGSLIGEFLKIFPQYKSRQDLWDINTTRNNIIHNMLKKKMSEMDIEHSFQGFFQKNDSRIGNVLKEFMNIFKKRPENLLKNIQTLRLNS